MISFSCDFCSKAISPNEHHRIEIRASSGKLTLSGDMCRQCVQRCAISPEVIVPVVVEPIEAVAEPEAPTKTRSRSKQTEF